LGLEKKTSKIRTPQVVPVFTGNKFKVWQKRPPKGKRKKGKADHRGVGGLIWVNPGWILGKKNKKKTIKEVSKTLGNRQPHPPQKG